MPKKPTKKGAGGRPPKHIVDEKMLETVKGLGQVHATIEECCIVLGFGIDGSGRSTWYQLRKRHPELQEAYDEGAAFGKVSLRREQFAMAKKNVGMSIWLGKQYLNQKEVQYQRDLDFSDMTDDELIEVLEDALRSRREAQANGDGEGATPAAGSATTH